MAKGQTSWMFNALVIFVAVVTLLSIVINIEKRTGSYIKEEVVDLQAERIVNAALALESTREGKTEVEMKDYKVEVDGGTVTVGYKDKNATREIESSFVDSSITGMEFQKVDKICLEKKIENEGTTIAVSPGGC